MSLSIIVAKRTVQKVSFYLIQVSKLAIDDAAISRKIISDLEHRAFHDPVILIHQSQIGTLFRGRKDVVEYLDSNFWRIQNHLVWYRVTLKD